MSPCGRAEDEPPAAPRNPTRKPRRQNIRSRNVFGRARPATNAWTTSLPEATVPVLVTVAVSVTVEASAVTESAWMPKEV
jgi:hypothetical protein